MTFGRRNDILCLFLGASGTRGWARGVLDSSLLHKRCVYLELRVVALVLKAVRFAGIENGIPGATFAFM